MHIERRWVEAWPDIEVSLSPRVRGCQAGRAGKEPLLDLKEQSPKLKERLLLLKEPSPKLRLRSLKLKERFLARKG